MWRSLVAPNRYKVIIRRLTQQTSHERTRKENFFLDEHMAASRKNTSLGYILIAVLSLCVVFPQVSANRRAETRSRAKRQGTWCAVSLCFFFLQWRLGKTGNVWLALAKLSQVFFLGEQLKLNDFFWYISISSKHGQACHRADFIINAFDPRVFLGCTWRHQKSN